MASAIGLLKPREGRLPLSGVRYGPALFDLLATNGSQTDRLRPVFQNTCSLSSARAFLYS